LYAGCAALVNEYTAYAKRVSPLTASEQTRRASWPLGGCPSPSASATAAGRTGVSLPHERQGHRRGVEGGSPGLTPSRSAPGKAGKE
jgi:hypothetical protein